MDVEDLLVRELDDRAAQVTWPDGFTHAIVATAHRRRTRRRATLLAVGAGVAATVAAATILLSGGGSRALVPVPPANSRTGEPAPSRFGSWAPLPAGRVSLAPQPSGEVTPPPHPEGCSASWLASAAAGEAAAASEEAWLSALPVANREALGLPVPVSQDALPAGDGSPGGPSGSAPARDADNPSGAPRRSPSPEAAIVQQRFTYVLDGDRFGGFRLDASGTGFTVYVVRGTTAEAATRAAVSCATSTVPVRVELVERSDSQLWRLATTMENTLPQSVWQRFWDSRLGPVVVPDRNRVSISLHGELTPEMKRDLWNRYGDALDVWLLDSETLAEPGPDWA